MRSLAAAAFALLAATALSAPADAARPVAFAQQAQQQGALVLPLGSAADLATRGTALSAADRQAVTRALESADFRYRRNAALTLRGIGPWSQITIVGTGTGALGARQLQDIGGVAARETASADGPVTIVATGIADAGEIATGARLGGYHFGQYKSQDPENPRAAGRDAPLTIIADSAAAAGRDWQGRGEILAESVAFTRNLINEPANIIYPESFVARAQEAFAGVAGVTIEVLDENRMREMGMGAILSVGQGSVRPPRMLAIHYRGSGATGQPVALVGKGNTFDTGGISLKPGSGMWRMKSDMSGAAAVVGTVLNLARSGAPVNVVAIAGLTENMPSGEATRPGDIVRAMNGKTIEVLNTDAEGRRILADAVAYAEQRYQPAAIVDVATLTGAISAAIGPDFAGLFSRHDGLAEQLLASSEETGEMLWRMPLIPAYGERLSSRFADITDIAEGGGPGAGIGAHFIGAFVTPQTPWAHLDIAGTAWSNNARPTAPAGAVGMPVRLLDHFVRNFRPVPAAAPDETAD